MGVQCATAACIGVDESVGCAERHGGQTLKLHASDGLFGGELAGEQIFEALLEKPVELIGSEPGPGRSAMLLGQVGVVIALAASAFAGQSAAVATDLQGGVAHG